MGDSLLPWSFATVVNRHHNENVLLKCNLIFVWLQWLCTGLQSFCPLKWRVLQSLVLSSLTVFMWPSACLSLFCLIICIDRTRWLSLYCVFSTTQITFAASPIYQRAFEIAFTKWQIYRLQRTGMRGATSLTKIPLRSWNLFTRCCTS